MRRNKIITYSILLSMGAMVFTGCSNSHTKPAKEATTEVKKESSDDLLKAVDYDVSQYVTLPENYMNMEIQLENKYEFNNDNFKEYVNNILSSYPGYKKTDKDTVAEKDLVNIDYEGKMNGETFEGGSDTGYHLLIGSHSFIEGFEEGLVGKKVGETVTLNLKFPDDYAQKDFAGKDVVFSVTINSIDQEEKITYDTMTDDYVKENLKTYYNVETKDALISALKEEYEHQLKDAKDNDTQQAVLKKLTEEGKITLPDGLLDKSVQEYKKNIEDNAKNNNMSYEDYLKQYYNNMTDEEFTKEIQTSCEANLKQELALQRVIYDQKITVSDSDFNDFVDQYVTYYGYNSKDEFFKQYGGENRLRLTFAENRALEEVTKNAKVTFSADAKNATPDAGVNTDATTATEQSTETTQTTEGTTQAATSETATDASTETSTETSTEKQDTLTKKKQ